MRPALLFAAAVVLAGCGGVGTQGSTGGYVSGNGSITVVAPKDREKAPVLAGDDLDGKALSTADLAGDTLVVNVWGSWCPPCRKEAPALAEVATQYADRDVSFVGVLVRDKPAAALAFTRTQETPYRSIADFSGRNLLGFSRSLPSQAIPTTWIIDDRGRVAVRIMDDVSASTLAGLIDDVQESTPVIDALSDTVASGSLLLAIPIAVLAGLVSFFSPCVIPLLPGYLSYVTGIAAQDLEHGHRGRMVLGSGLFVLGFTAVFVAGGSLFGALGGQLLEHRRTLTIVMGVVVIVLGFVFMGFVPFLQREVKVHAVPAVGLGVAPLLGALFGLGWIPCVSPTLGAVLTLAGTEGTAARGALLSAAYCLGLGLPFIVAALAFERFMHALGWVRRHQRAVMVAGGGMLVVVGVLLVTGAWDTLVTELLSRVGTGSIAV